MSDNYYILLNWKNIFEHPTCQSTLSKRVKKEKMMIGIIGDRKKDRKIDR